MLKLVLAAMCIIFPAAVVGQEERAPATLLSIYSSAKLDDFDPARLMKGNASQIPGMVIVQQRRTLELDEGESRIDLPGIASTADFSTLLLRAASANSFKVISQSLVEPATDPEAFLRRAVGHEIIINRKAPPGGEHRTPETINARLLAFDQNQLVIQTSNRQLPVQIIPRNADIAEIKIMADSAAPSTRPAASARVTAGKGGPQEAILSYQASGITWHAAYDIVLGEDQSKAQFNSSITILNRSGASFDDARITLIAHNGDKSGCLLPQSISLGTDAAHRVALFDAANVSCQTVLVYARSSASVSTYLAIENSSKNNLSRALPAGRVRVIKQTAPDTAATLLADEVLPASAQNDLILVRIGPASQVTARREFSERIDTDKTSASETIKITLRNPTEQPQKILLLEPRPASASQIIEKSAEYQMQSQSLLFGVELPANDQKVVSYTIRRPAQ